MVFALIIVMAAEATQESLLLKAIISQLIRSLREKNFDYNTFLTKTKVMKIVFDVIKEMKMPITNSWYMRGCYVYSAMEESPLMDPKTWDNMDTEEMTCIEAENKDLCHQIKTEILKYLDTTEVLTTSNDAFLDYVYKEFAPREYKNVYLVNHTLLRLLQISVNDLIDSFNEGKCMFRFSDIDISILDRFSPNISKFQMALSNTEGFDEEQDIFYDFFNLLEDILVKFDYNLKNTDSISHETKDFFGTLSNIYYHKIWKLVALKISQNTVVGNRSESIKKKQIGEHDILIKEMPKIIKDIRSRALEINLIPDHKEYERYFTKKYSVSQETRKELSKIL